MKQTVCVYCASSNDVASEHFTVAYAAGALLAEQGYRLIYGGGSHGLMGTLARAVQEHGGYVTGVIPRALKSVEGIAFELADEMIVTETMQERKAIMFTRADAFLVLPGGFGTLEEFLEVLTLKQLRYHNKAIVLLNTDGFWDPLIRLFDHFYEGRFARRDHRLLYDVASDVGAALEYFETYLAEDVPDKWS